MKNLFVKTITKSITNFKTAEIKRSLWKDIKGGASDGGSDILIEDTLDL